MRLVLLGHLPAPSDRDQITDSILNRRDLHLTSRPVIPPAPAAPGSRRESPGFDGQTGHIRITTRNFGKYSYVHYPGGPSRTRFRRSRGDIPTICGLLCSMIGRQSPVSGPTGRSGGPHDENGEPPSSRYRVTTIGMCSRRAGSRIPSRECLFTP